MDIDDDMDVTCCLCRKPITDADEEQTLPATTVPVHRACWVRELDGAGEGEQRG